MFIFLLALLLAPACSIMGAASSTSEPPSLSERLENNKKIIAQLTRSTTVESTQTCLDDIELHEIPTTFHKYSSTITELISITGKISSEQTRMLSPAFIDDLLQKINKQTIPETELRMEVARCTLAVAEKVDFQRPIAVQYMHAVKEVHSLDYLSYIKKMVRIFKTNIMGQLLYALREPKPSTDLLVYLCLEELGLNIAEPLSCPYTDLAIKELEFIKSHLPLLAPTKAAESSDPAYGYTMLKKFFTTDKRSRRGAYNTFYFDEGLAKILVLLDRHSENYSDDDDITYLENSDDDDITDPEDSENSDHDDTTDPKPNKTPYPDYAELICWRYDLFTGIEAPLPQEINASGIIASASDSNASSSTEA